MQKPEGILKPSFKIRDKFRALEPVKPRRNEEASFNGTSISLWDSTQRPPETS